MTPKRHGMPDDFYLFCENRLTSNQAFLLTTGTFNLFVKDPNRSPPRRCVLSDTRQFCRVSSKLFSPYSAVKTTFRGTLQTYPAALLLVKSEARFAPHWSTSLQDTNPAELQLRPAFKQARRIALVSTLPAHSKSRNTAQTTIGGSRQN
jgi:hypothetical protein